MWKRFVGKTLFRVCNQFPSVKHGLAGLGMRCKVEWFANRLGKAQLPDGRNLKLASVGRNYLSFQLFWLGTRFYEPLTTLVMQKLLRPGDTFFDVGANIGFYSLVMTLTTHPHRVVAFEPNPRVLSLLQANISANGFREITCEPMALTDFNGTAPLHLSHSDHSASLRADFADPCCGKITVPTTTLDAYMDRVRPALSGRLVVKMDVEGNETAVLSGGCETLASLKPDVVVEVAQSSPIKPDFLGDLGYRSYSITDQGLLETSTWAPYVRSPFVFLNQLLTTRPPEVVAALSDEIMKVVKEIDFTKTSKLADAVVLQRAMDVMGPGAGVDSKAARVDQARSQAGSGK